MLGRVKKIPLKNMDTCKDQKKKNNGKTCGMYISIAISISTFSWELWSTNDVATNWIWKGIFIHTCKLQNWTWKDDINKKKRSLCSGYVNISFWDKTQPTCCPKWRLTLLLVLFSTWAPNTKRHLVGKTWGVTKTFPRHYKRIKEQPLMFYEYFIFGAYR